MKTSISKTISKTPRLHNQYSNYDWSVFIERLFTCSWPEKGLFSCNRPGEGLLSHNQPEKTFEVCAAANLCYYKLIESIFRVSGLLTICPCFSRNPTNPAFCFWATQILLNVFLTTFMAQLIKHLKMHSMIRILINITIPCLTRSNTHWCPGDWASLSVLTLPLKCSNFCVVQLLMYQFWVVTQTQTTHSFKIFTLMSLC